MNAAATASLAHAIKHLPVMQETRVWSRGQRDDLQEDPLEQEMATHSGIFARKIPWTEEPVGLQSEASQSQTGLRD